MATRTPLAAALEDIEAPARLSDAEQLRRIRAVVNRAIDEALDLVEEANLRGDTRVTQATRVMLITSLSAAAGPIPDVVARAAKPSVLHAALLDWHEELLDTLMPHRHRAPAVAFEERLQWALDLDESDGWLADQLGAGDEGAAVEPA